MVLVHNKVDVSLMQTSVHNRMHIGDLNRGLVRPRYSENLEDEDKLVMSQVNATILFSVVILMPEWMSTRK